MFGLLKNKLAGFIKGIVGREEKKDAPAQAAPVQKAEEAPEKMPVPVQPTNAEQPKQAEQQKQEPQKHIERQVRAGQPKTKEAPQKMPEAPLKTGEKKQEQPSAGEKKPEPEHRKVPVPAAAHKHPEKKQPAPFSQPSVQHEPPEPPAQLQKPEAEQSPVPKAQPESQTLPKAQHKPEAVPLQPQQFQPPAVDMSRLERRASSEKRVVAPKFGIGTAIKSFFSSDVTIGEADVSDLLEGLELSLLEADVAYDVSLEVTQQLKTRLVGMKVPKGQVGEKTRQAVQQVLEGIMESDRKFDLLSRVGSLEKPVKILFVGPNGAGKTTTMAKLAHLFMAAGLSVVFSASDTFRAAAVEQTEVHAERLGAKVIKSKYGADPSSVAFDAVNFARSHSVDVVLIDSAGRQDTNANLLSELKKMNRIAKPDIKIYIGESIGGNSVIEQIRAFNEAIGIDGAILTKIDCDAKGGTAISIAKSTGIPVLFLGFGQGYSDLVPFDPHKIAQEIMA